MGSCGWSGNNVGILIMKNKNLVLRSLPIVSLLVLGGLLFSSCAQKEEASKVQTKQMWISPMHPWIKSDKPGPCPICGMALVPMEQYEAKQKAKGESTVGQETKRVMLSEAKESVASIKIAVAEERQLDSTLEAFGSINYIQDKHRDVTWYYDLKIEQVLISYNTTEVQAGQPILKVFSDAAVAEQEGYLQVLRERWLSTFYERKLMDARLAASRSLLERIGMTEQDLKQLVKNKEIQTSFIIRSPITGSLVNDLPHSGEWVEKNKPLFHVVPLDRVWFEADFYEKDLALLKLGQKGLVKTQAYPDLVSEATLVYLDRRINPENRTLRVRFELENKGLKYVPNLAGTVKVSLGNLPQHVVIPMSAVIDTGSRKVAYVKSAAGVYELREVNLGRQAGDYVEVLSGVRAGEEVAASGAFLLDAEAQLRGNFEASGSTITPTKESITVPNAGHQHEGK